MYNRVAIVYNQPCSSKYVELGEQNAEEDVLNTVIAVHKALGDNGYIVIDVPLAPPVGQAREMLKKMAADIVFNLFEGFCGYPLTESDIPDALVELGIPFTGCSASSIQQTLNKVDAKLVLNCAGIATPQYQLLTPDSISLFDIGYPCIVKPAYDDASHGLSAESVVRNSKSLKAQVEKISRIFEGKALVEQFIDGREFNATVLGDREFTVFPISEIRYDLPECLPPILTYDAKWNPQSLYFQSTNAECPATLTQTESDQIVKTAQKAFKVLVGRGYARIDMRMDLDGNIYVLEVNANPDISPQSGAALQACKMGLRYVQFIEKLVKLAWSN